MARTIFRIGLSVTDCIQSWAKTTFMGEFLLVGRAARRKPAG
jgi:hypothetical protein